MLTRSLRLVVRGVAGLLIGAVMLVSLSVLVASVLGYDRYVITGGSMAGTIERGALAFERPVAVEQLQPGDVITYLPPEDSRVPDLVTHRIVSVEVDPATGVRTFRTQGDANPQRDPWTFQMVGDQLPRVEFTVPLVGYAFIALADPRTRMLVIGLPAAVIALLAAVELARALRRPGAAEAPRVTEPAGA